MDPVLYFKVLSIVWGALIVLRGPLVQLVGRAWLRLVPEVAWPESRPFWHWLTAFLTLVVVAATWWVFAESRVPWALAATLLVTLSVVRASQVLFNYAHFRRLMVRLAADRPRALAALNAVLTLLGLALILLGIFVYR